MNSLVTAQENLIPAMSTYSVEKVRALESCSAALLPQVNIATSHVLHAGMYARTIMIPAGVMLTGALIKVATVLIFSGHAHVFIGDETAEINGYRVLAASAHRKQAFVAVTDTYLTMLFKSEADTYSQAEDEFTDEPHILMSRKDGAINKILVTGE